MIVDSVPCVADVQCRVKREIETQCPIKPESDAYEIEVSWRPAGETLEKHAVVDTIDSLSGTESTQEELAATIFDACTDSDIDSLSVSVVDTKHMDMEVVAE